MSVFANNQCSQPIVDTSIPHSSLMCIESAQSAHVKVNGQDTIVLCSNNYLGLANHPKVVAAAKEAIDRYGVGTAAARSLAGNTPEHEALEKEISDFKTTEATILFNSGYTGNVGTIAAITGPDDMIFSDSQNHGSIIDGSRLSKAKIAVYPHLDMDALENGLKNAAGCRQRMIVTDSVFSMEGSIAPLDKMVELTERYNAFLMVDEAHATGVLGDHGSGVVEMMGLQRRIAVVLGTLGKALGTIGGYVTGSNALIQHLRRNARSFLFTTSLPAHCVAAGRAALQLLRESPQLQIKLWENTRFFTKEMKKLGLNILDTQTPIVPIMVGDLEKANRLTCVLSERGILTHTIGYPYVPRGSERLRTIISAAHTREDLEKAIEIIGEAAKSLDITKETN